MKQIQFIGLFLIFSFVQCKKTRDARFDEWILQNMAKMRLGEFAKNDSIFKHTLAQAKSKLSSNDSMIALIFHKIAANYKNNDYWKPAIVYCDSALAIREKVLAINHIDIAKTYIVRGSAQLGCRNHPKAIEDLNKGLQIFLNAPKQDSVWIGIAYKDLAACASESSDLYQALTTYDNALRYIKPSENNYIQCFMQLGTVHDLLNQPKQAVAHYQKALNLFILRSDSSFMAGCHVNLGISHSKMMQYDTAFRHFNQALSIYKQLKNNDLRIANTYIEISKTHLLQKQYEQALQTATNSLNLRKKVHFEFLKHYDIAESHTVLGDIASVQNDFQTALNHYESAINAFDERTFTPVQQIEPLFGKAKMLIQLGRKKEALIVFNALDAVIQQVTKLFKEDKSKFNLVESHFSIYEKAIQTAFELFESSHDSTLLQQAFQFSSHSKAVALRQAVNDEKAKVFAKISPEILENERSLKQEVAFQQKQCSEKASETNYKLLYQAKEALTIFVADLEKRYPKYYELKYQSAQVIDLKRLQQSLPNEMMSLEFFAGDSMLYTFALTRNQLKIYQLPMTKIFDTTIYQVRKSVVEANQSLKMDYLNGAHELYKLLLEKPLKDLNSNQKMTRLRIIPDGKLGYIPFDALLTAPATDWLDKYDKKIPFLLRTYATSYAYYSDSVLNQKALTVKGDFHGFGIDYKDSVTNKSLKNKYGWLEDAPREVDTIKHLIGGKTWKNEWATKQCFIDNSKKSGILHLSMHSTTNDKNPLESQLIFSKNDSTDDNLLIGNELFAQQFNCGLAVLSACHTGDGQLQRGEGIMSLARAFAYSGCPSLVMSLWSIPDQSTSTIMLHFYQNLKHNLPKDVALQQSKLQYLENQSFEPSQKIPNFWAATVMIGDVNELHFERWYEQCWLILLIIIILGIVFFAFRRAFLN